MAVMRRSFRAEQLADGQRGDVMGIISIDAECPAPQAMTRQETRSRLAVDRQRLTAAMREAGQVCGAFWLVPAWQAVWLYRWSYFHFVNGRRLLSRAYWHLNLLLTGADINPLSEIGPGLLLSSPLGVVIVGRLGANVTVYGHVGIGGGLSQKDIGAGSGLPVVEDDVVLHFSAVVLGPVRIGKGARLGARTLVTRDIPSGGVVTLDEPRILRRGSTDDEGG